MSSAAKPHDFLEAGRLLFSGEAEFIWASSAISNLPPVQELEIAFAGRSNVGKSSLINALTNRKALARTSHTPGRTQELNFFNIHDAFRLVDMPGYGYAAAGKDKAAAWTRLIHSYLRGRPSLARVYLLIDARHGFKPLDLAVLDTLDTMAVSYQIVLTKADEVKAGDLESCVENTQAAIRKRPAAFPEIRPTSSRDMLGIAELRANIACLLQERGSNHG